MVRRGVSDDVSLWFDAQYGRKGLTVMARYTRTVKGAVSANATALNALPVFEQLHAGTPDEFTLVTIRGNQYPVTEQTAGNEMTPLQYSIVVEAIPGAVDCYRTVGLECPSQDEIDVWAAEARAFVSNPLFVLSHIFPKVGDVVDHVGKFTPKIVTLSDGTRENKGVEKWADNASVLPVARFTRVTAEGHLPDGDGFAYELTVTAGARFTKLDKGAVKVKGKASLTSDARLAWSGMSNNNGSGFYRLAPAMAGVQPSGKHTGALYTLLDLLGVKGEFQKLESRFNAEILPLIALPEGVVSGGSDSPAVTANTVIRSNAPTVARRMALPTPTVITRPATPAEIAQSVAASQPTVTEVTPVAPVVEPTVQPPADDARLSALELNVAMLTEGIEKLLARKQPGRPRKNPTA